MRPSPFFLFTRKQGMNAVYHLIPDAVALGRVADKRGALAQLATLFAVAYGYDEVQVLDALEERESLGSTGFGRGVAIPHARLGGGGVPAVAVIRLDQPIDFGAADGMSVELIFGLVSPLDAGAIHLHALAKISRIARDEAFLERLLGAPDAEALYALLAHQDDHRDAA